MTNTMSNTRVSCPTCGNKVVWGPESQFRPFCSDRCRLIDLGAWANEEYGVPAEEPPDGFDEALQGDIPPR